MAESVVSLLLNKIASLTEEELKLLRGVWGEVASIIDELGSMRAFLRIADAMEERDEQLKVWVKQVRDVAYDTQDVLDEYTLHLAHHHGGHGFYASLRKIYRLVKNLKSRHQIASEIQSIKSRVRNIYERYQRYHYEFNGGSACISAANSTWHDCRGNALLLEEAELVGLEKPKKKLIKLLVEGDSELKVVSVLGMGGLGKTTLVKKVYDDTEVKKHFQSHAWITVSQSFKIEELVKDIIRQLYDEIGQPAPHGVDTIDNHRLKAIVKEFLRQRKYVLILDDVWSIDAWEALKYALPNSKCGSRVMLTTRSADIASTSCKESHGNVYTLKPLSLEESWKLFCKKTFQSNSCPPHLKELCRCILQRCEGLPLAIVVISGVLSIKDESKIDEWEMVHRSLGAELEGNEKLGSIKNILSLSYNDLPYYLKSCFSYLSVFPEDYPIRHMRLIRLWIAEGFVEAKEGKTLEEVAESYLNELINRSLIQIARTRLNGRVYTCRIHDLLREIILSKSRDQNFVTIANEQSTRCPEKIRRLSVHKTFETIQLNKNVSQLRSLLMFRLPSESSKVTLFGGRLRLLTVLDLQDAPLEIFPDEVVKLYHLRYLSLRRTKVKKLPSSIGNLQNLETLDLKHAYVTVLPVEILKLKRLRHLLVYRYEYSSYSLSVVSTYGFKPAEGMGDLLSLQKLCYVEANQSRGIMRELGRLNQLRRLGIRKLRREDGVALCSSIEKLGNLRSLSVSSIEEGEIIDLQCMSSPPRFLQHLWLRGRLEKLPHWIPSLHSMVKLCLRWSRLRDDPLEFLHALPNLAELRLVQAYDGEILCFKAGWFQRLKLLVIDQMDGLRRVIVEEKAMPYLETLLLSSCKLLEEVPSGIEFLKYLQLLDCFDMSNQFMKDLYYERRAEYMTSKIAHIREVNLIKWEDGHLVRQPLQR